MRNRQGMKSIWVVLALVALAVSSTVAVMGANSVTPPLRQDATATPAEGPFADDTAYAEDLWQRLQEANYDENWSTVPGKGELYPGQPPHGALLSTYLNAPALDALEAQPGEMPNSAIIIKENYLPDETLVSVTVMEKRAGYAPDYGDWYWARYGPDGAVQGSGQIASCLGCHGAVRSNDYIFTFVVAPIDVSALTTPSPEAEVTAAEATETESAEGESAETEAVETPTSTGTPTPSPETATPEATGTQETGDEAANDEAADEEAEDDGETQAQKPSDQEAEAATPMTTPEPLSDEELIAQGEAIYTRVCAACHQADGQGVAGAYPALAGNPFVTGEDPTPMLRVIFTGRAGMPHFRDYLTEQEIASVVSYIRNAWENDAAVVNVEQVNEVQSEIYSPSERMEHRGDSE
ncbi:MAG: c-type cytochrome [Caldilineaceae bacterium]